jgi:hypothetical protein
LKKEVYDQLEAHFGATEKWKNLDEAYVNFTHWALVAGDHGSAPYQKNGFYVSWLRHNAYICQTNFPSIDLVIPMAFRNCFAGKDVVTPECLSHISISVKNCDDTEGIGLDILSKEVIEGVIAVKQADDTKKKGQKKGRKKDKKRKLETDSEGNQEAEAYYTHSNPNLNVRLTLNAVKFINPEGVFSAIDAGDCWIRPSEKKPYIAFAMSMGQTERQDKLFVAEEVSFYMSPSYLLVQGESTSHCVCLEGSHKYI